eukprot:gnl/MRDRNA2_/MRDRNA2_28322_c0_seq1.p1 gnl/MRDRNA2_/MRDRNA2_28322_c0~~gnl/MRDRNA2_/MRDRNA2_28322_c0_seq1.p1  ORF type:complete len:127 (+),score=22.52 gnl/MRDRNA2_/MRDRNA2_28322_c0_seq1:168-548(+)
MQMTALYLSLDGARETNTVFQNAPLPELPLKSTYDKCDNAKAKVDSVLLKLAVDFKLPICDCEQAAESLHWQPLVLKMPIQDYQRAKQKADAAGGNAPSDLIRAGLYCRDMRELQKITIFSCKIST